MHYKIVPEIVSINRSENGKNPVKRLWKLFQSFDHFTKVTIITCLLFILATPSIVNNSQIFNPHAAGPFTSNKGGGQTLKVGKGRFKTITEALQKATPGSQIIVYPGIYNERITLKDKVNFYLYDGVVIDYSSTTDILATISDEGSPVTASIDGFGIIKRNGADVGVSGSGVEISNPGTSLNLKCKQIIVDTSVWGVGIYVGNGNLNSTCDVTSSGIGVRTNSFGYDSIISIQGNIYSHLDYGVLSGGGKVTVKGNITADKNSAMHCSGGECEFSGTATSNGLFGFEMSGGTALIHDSKIVSTVNNGRLEEEDSINKYGGDTLTLDNVTLLAIGSTARSIGEQGRADSVTVLRTSYANKEKSSLITIVGGELLIDPTLSLP